MEQIKIVFFDVDGTLIDYKADGMSAKTVEMLKGLQAKGIKVCIASGRAPMQMPQVDGVTFDVYLTYSGSYCYTGAGEIIFNNPLHKQDVLQIAKNSQEINRPMVVATVDRMAANWVDEDLHEYYIMGGIDLKPAPDFQQVLQDDVYQIMAAGRVPERPNMIKNTENAKIAAWWDRAFDIVPADGGKGRGGHSVLEYFGLKPSEAMAFGDGNNDLEMFQALDYCVAMGNGSEDLKKIAWATCGNCEDDGIYYFCKKNKLI